MTEKDLEEFEKEFGFKLLPTSFKKPLSEITKEEYKERIEYLYNAIINDDSNDEDLMIYEKEIKVLEKALDRIVSTIIEEEVELYEDHEAYTINKALLKAIQQQSKELGWLEEETCTNESEYNLVDGFECSNCGIIIENYNEIEIDEDCPEDRCMKEYAPRYCPNCGKKIVD